MTTSIQVYRSRVYGPLCLTTSHPPLLAATAKYEALVADAGQQNWEAASGYTKGMLQKASFLYKTRLIM